MRSKASEIRDYAFMRILMNNNKSTRISLIKGDSKYAKQI